MFEFAWPWIFLLAPLPWVLRRLLPPADSGESALRVSFLGELEGLAGRRAKARLPAWQGQAPFALIWLLLLLAAARPQWIGEAQPLPTSGRDLLLAVDVSGSMDYPDMHWQGEDISRLELVKALFADFIEGRRGDRVGLILFGSQAYRVFAGPDAPESFAALAPERTVMVACLSKSIAPGLRLGFILPPEREGARDRLLLGIRALGYSPPSLGGLVFSQWQRDGTADGIADEVLQEAAARTRLATNILGKRIAVPGAPQSLHVWMPMALIEAERLTARALRAGIALTPPDGPAVDPDGPSGVRLCLGGIADRARLETALHALRDMVDAGTCRSAMGLV